MLTTLYCDASFCPNLLVGGWAVWLRSDRGRHVESGVVPDYCDLAIEAELAAIYAGLYRALACWPDTSAILVRSDCTGALRWMSPQHRASHKGARRLQARITELQSKHKTKFIPRWVKGHSGSAKTDAWLNRRVDALAGDIMRQERKRAQSKAAPEGTLRPE